MDNKQCLICSKKKSIKVWQSRSRRRRSRGGKEEGVSFSPTDYGAWGASLASSPSGVRGGALPENKFWCILSLRKTRTAGTAYPQYQHKLSPDIKQTPKSFDFYCNCNLKCNGSSERTSPPFPVGDHEPCLTLLLGATPVSLPNRLQLCTTT